MASGEPFGAGRDPGAAGGGKSAGGSGRAAAAADGKGVAGGGCGGRSADADQLAEWVAAAVSVGLAPCAAGGVDCSECGVLVLRVVGGQLWSGDWLDRGQLDDHGLF